MFHFPGKDVTPVKDSTKNNDDLQEMRENIGEKGCHKKTNSYGDFCRNFILRKAKEDSKLKKEDMGKFSTH